MGQVFKWGCATGLTAGKILVVSDPYFDVESTEVGDFAMRGDSGSLIVCTLKDGTNWAIGVISVFEAKRKIVRCVMLKYAYQIGYLESASEYNKDDEGLDAAGEESKKAACVAENTANDGIEVKEEGGDK